MTIPTPLELMIPILDFSKDKEEKNIDQTLEYLKDKFELTPDEINSTNTNGHSIISNNIKSARKYLVQSGLLEYTKKEYAKITKNGLKVLQNKTQ